MDYLFLAHNNVYKVYSVILQIWKVNAQNDKTKRLRDTAKWQIKISLFPNMLSTMAPHCSSEPQFSQLYNGNVNKKINQSL